MQMILTLAYLTLLIFALVDLITSDSWQVKHLPKVTWVFIILFLPLIGSIIWLLVGKDRAPVTDSWGSFGDPRRHEHAVPLSTTEQELAALDREIEFHEKREKLKRLEAELEQKRQDRSQP
jgi:hypothetical protein